ncbi:MAG: glycosyltransferase [Flavobacteriales bacterium]|nr:glycosyltransferase [Flavobacteriales bacterium]
MRILHIVNWYPNVIDGGAGPFIRRHVLALMPHAEQEVWHLEVRQAKGWRLERLSLHADRTCMLVMPLNIWYLIEWVSTFMLLWAWWTRDRSRQYDLINVHIAYPLLTHLRLIRYFIRVPLVVTEQWSAYHFSFNSTSKGLDRIRRIFRNDLPLICVSRALGADIGTFAKREDLRVHVVDNVAETAVFHPTADATWTEGRFFALSGWRFPKRPDTLIEALAQVRAAGRPMRLRLGGNGPKMEAMKEAIARLGLAAHVDLLGHLSPEDAAREMRAAHAVLHASDYETYCAVCAEALCCGTPVIASAVGGIREYLEPGMGRQVADNEAATWTSAILEMWDPTCTMDRQRISERMTARASTQAVGSRYADILHQILEGQAR